MKTNWDTIFPEIRDKLKIEHKTGYIGRQFIEDTISHRVVVRHPSIRRIKIYQGENAFSSLIKFCNFMTLSNELLEDEALMTKIFTQAEVWASKPIWRINQKRIKHGLESWF